MYARLQGRHLRVRLPERIYRRLDNGHMVSIGLTDEDVSATRLRRWEARGMVNEITFEEWNHSSCQSSCAKRGDKTCAW